MVNLADDGLATIKIRVQNRNPKVDVKHKTPIRILPKIWNFDRNSDKFQKLCSNPEIKKIFDDTDEIRRIIEGKLSAGNVLVAADVHDIIESVIYRDIQAQRKIPVDLHFLCV